MSNFEYFIFHSNNMPLVGNGHEDLVRLNELGREGWDLVWIEVTNPITINLLFFSTSKAHKERIFYLRREIE